MRSYGLSLASKGVLGYTVGLATKGVLYHVTITETPVEVPTEPSGGAYAPGPKNLPRYKFTRPPKWITVSLYAYGNLYSETVLVDDFVDVTIDNVKIIESEDGIKIEIVGVRTY